MGLNERSPGAGDGARSAFSYPIARSFGFLVLVAIVIIFALRHIFGSFRVEGGTR